jgi:Ca2+-binding EF-hand superfamily protein
MADARAKLTKAFQEVDKDHNGTIDQGELERVLSAYYKASGKPVDTGKVKSESAAFMKEVDTNHDNKITLDEFVKYFSKFC